MKIRTSECDLPEVNEFYSMGSKILPDRTSKTDFGKTINTRKKYDYAEKKIYYLPTIYYSP